MLRLLADYPVTVELAIQWGDMDAFQHVNNAMFFRYFETARIAYVRAMGAFDYRARVRPILAATSCQFKAPLHYPDTITVGARVPAHAIGEDRFAVEHAIASHNLDRIVAVGEGVLVSYDYEASLKVPLPAAWREAIARLQG